MYPLRFTIIVFSQHNVCSQCALTMTCVFSHLFSPFPLYLGSLLFFLEFFPAKFFLYKLQLYMVHRRSLQLNAFEFQASFGPCLLAGSSLTQQLRWRLLFSLKLWAALPLFIFLCTFFLAAKSLLSFSTADGFYGYFWTAVAAAALLLPDF